MATNVTFHDSVVNRKQRAELVGNEGFTIWLTGLPASGKSTLSVELEKRLFERSINSYRLDGDNIRHGLNKNLGFSPEDREENIRRISEVSKLFADACVVAITAFISPYRSDRLKARESHAKDGIRFVEVFVDCPLETAEKRDPKGLYKKARAGEIKQFTGIDAPYEAPQSPELVVKTSEYNVTECVDYIIKYLETNSLIKHQSQNKS